MDTVQSLRHADSELVLPKPARPGSFAGLMTLYESNFVRLRWLLPHLPRVHTAMVSFSGTDAPLYLQVTEVSRHTTTLVLTYLFQNGVQLDADPNLCVRVYHDAMMAEAMDCSSRHRHPLLQKYFTASGSELEQRWQRNMMLNKWLEFCADSGHGFDALPA